MKKLNFILSTLIILTLTFFFVFDRYDVAYLLNPSYYGWQEQYGSSLGQHLAGWYSFFYDDWYFPLTITKGINHPNFNSIILSDSIPLLAVLSKAIKPILSEKFHYFGIWQIISIFLLFHSCYLLCYKRINSNPIICTFFCILCISSYLLFSRNSNYSTICHFLVYYALYFYLELKDGIDKKKIIFSTILLLSSLLIMFYFYAMVFVLLLCGYLQGFSNGNYTIKYKLSVLFYFFSIILLTGFVFGFFYNLSGLNYIRITSTGMPILSLFFISNELNFNTLLGNNLNVMGDSNQYESLNYLGLGIIILIFISIKKINFILIKNNKYLFTFFTLIFIYSLGSKIYFLDNLIFSYDHTKIPFLEFVAGKLAVVGRLFIFNYTILTFVFFKFLIGSKNHYSVLVAFFLVILQFFDVYYLNFSEGRFESNIDTLLNEKKMMKYNQEYSENYKNYQNLLNEIDANIIYVIPPYNCKGSKDGSIFYAKIIREKKLTNNIWFGRDNHPCTKKIIEAENAIKNKKDIEFIFIDHLLNEERFNSLLDAKSKFLNCRDIDYLEDIDHCK